ncbi:hypothetical protein [Kitasatospora sp. NPDC101183]|uniref:hypothetical protein n=1 Tax=Kitasatospora sp. NPDC101183 TaxID=3364100 RepID=UPI00382D0BA3
MVLARLGDFTGAREHLHRALDGHGLDRRRTRAIVLADLGAVRLRQGDVSGALAAWHDFLGCADGIRSARVHRAIGDMRADLRSHRGVSGVAELDERAAGLE